MTTAVAAAYSDSALLVSWSDCTATFSTHVKLDCTVNDPPTIVDAVTLTAMTLDLSTAVRRERPWSPVRSGDVLITLANTTSMMSSLSMTGCRWYTMSIDPVTTRVLSATVSANPPEGDISKSGAEKRHMTTVAECSAEPRIVARSVFCSTLARGGSARWDVPVIFTMWMLRLSGRLDSVMLSMTTINELRVTRNAPSRVMLPKSAWNML